MTAPREAPWYPLAQGIASAPAVRRLGIALKKPEAWAHLFYAWVDCRQHNRSRVFEGQEAPLAFEQAAQWRGRPGRLASVALEVGLLRSVDGGLYLLSDQEAMGGDVDWSRTGDEPDAALTAKDKRQAYLERERIRKSNKRKTDKAAVVSADMSASVRAVSADSPQPEADTARTNVRFAPVSAPARAHETETKTETKTKMETHLSSSAQPATSADATPPPEAKPKALDPVEAKVTDVLEHWRERVKQPGWAIEGKGSEKRRARVRSRLEEGLTVEQLKRAADGYEYDDWLNGRKEGSAGYPDVSTLYRDRPQVERLIALANSPPKRKPERWVYNSDTEYEPNDPEFIAMLEAMP